MDDALINALAGFLSALSGKMPAESLRAKAFVGYRAAEGVVHELLRESDESRQQACLKELEEMLTAYLFR